MKSAEKKQQNGRLKRRMQRFFLSVMVQAGVTNYNERAAKSLVIIKMLEKGRYRISVAIELVNCS